VIYMDDVERYKEQVQYATQSELTLGPRELLIDGFTPELSYLGEGMWSARCVVDAEAKAAPICFSVRVNANVKAVHIIEGSIENNAADAEGTPTRGMIYVTDGPMIGGNQIPIRTQTVAVTGQFSPGGFPAVPGGQAIDMAYRHIDSKYFGSEGWAISFLSYDYLSSNPYTFTFKFRVMV